MREPSSKHFASDDTLGPYPVHLQIYTYSDLYAGAMKSMLGKAYLLFEHPANALLGRLMVIQGYLHSNLSGTASVSLRDGNLVLKKHASPTASRVVRATVAKLRRHARALGFGPSPPCSISAIPGKVRTLAGPFPCARLLVPWSPTRWAGRSALVVCILWTRVCCRAFHRQQLRSLPWRTPIV